MHALSSRIADDAVPQNMTLVRMYGGYGVYDTDRWEHIAEVYFFNDGDLDGNTGSHRSKAGFLQLGYRAAWGVPYARYERTSLDQSDNYFSAQASGFSYYRSAIGLRYDIDLKSALKFELAHTNITDRAIDQVTEILAQYAIRF